MGNELLVISAPSPRAEKNTSGIELLRGERVGVRGELSDLLSFFLPFFIALFLIAPAAPAEVTTRRHFDDADLESWLTFLGDKAPERDQAMREMILTWTLADEARRRGLHLEPATRLELAAAEAAMAERLLKRFVNESLVITDEDVEAKYQSIKDTYTRPKRWRLYNIFKRFPPASEADEATRDTIRRDMEELRERLLAGADFKQTATQESDSQTRWRKGLLGNVTKGMFPPAVEAVALALQPGEISEILEGPDGLTIFYCEKILEKVYRSPEELREISARLLRDQRFKKRWAEFRQELLQSAAPLYRWSLLQENAEGNEISDSEIFVEIRGGTLTMGELREVFKPDDPAALTREELQEKLAPVLIQRRMPREARVRGLLSAEVRERWGWMERKTLATRTLVALVGERFQSPNAEAIEQYYEEHREEFVRDARFHLGVITLTVDREHPRMSYERGEALARSLEKGEITFEEAARRHSKHPSADNGGDLGWIPRPALTVRLGFSVLRAVQQMEAGTTSDLFEDKGTLWILRLKAMEPQRLMSFEEARTTIENRLGNAEAQRLEPEVIESWLQGLEIR